MAVVQERGERRWRRLGQVWRRGALREGESVLDINMWSSSETQGQLVGAGKSLNGREKFRAKKSQEGEEEPLGTSAAFHYAEDSGNFGRNSNFGFL